MKDILQKAQSMIHSFSFAQMTSNSDGKTSASGSMGVYITLIGGFCFLAGCFDHIFGTKDSEIMMYSGGVITAGSILLGHRKSKEKVVSHKTMDMSKDELKTEETKA